MERHELAPGLTIARVLTGLWQIADMERGERSMDLDGAAAAMGPYAEAGFTTFDMADHYGSAEVISGRFRAGYAGELELLTKWVPQPGATDRDEVRAAVERGLERLGVDSIDLLQFHAWSYWDPAYLDCLFALQELRDAGLIRHLGLTNFDAAHLALVLESGIEVISNQVCFSLLDRRPANGMLELCQRYGVGLLAYGTLAGGFLTDRFLDVPEPDSDDLATWSLMKYGRFLAAAGGWERLQDLLRALEGIAARHQVSIANVAARYVLQQPAVAGVIIGARLGESEHIAENLRLFDFDLGSDDLAEVASALSELASIPGDCGDEYRRPPFLTASGDLRDHFEELPPPYESLETRPGRSRALSGTVWEDLAGFSRAVRHGDRILVSGTTATHLDRAIGGGDSAAQTHFVIDKIEGALRSLGGSLEDVVRTRIFVPEKGDWEAIARAHGARFGRIQPANTLVRAELVGDEYLVEMEAEAVVGTG